MAFYIQIMPIIVQIYTFNMYIIKIWVYVLCKLLLLFLKISNVLFLKMH